MSSAARLAPLL